MHIKYQIQCFPGEEGPKGPEGEPGLQGEKGTIDNEKIGKI